MDLTTLLVAYSSDNAVDLRNHWSDMQYDAVSVSDTPIDSGTLTPERSPLQRQRASLQTYVDSLPYECESVEEMQARLEFIVGKIFVCAQAKNWLVLTNWDGLLQCWLLMRYPMATATRAKIVRLYYELCLLPGVEPRVIRSWAKMLSRLLSSKPGRKRTLEAADLELPWLPLWRILQKELWPKKRIQDPSRNVVNVLLFVAEQCKKYYPASEIPDMLSAFFPLLTNDSVLTMIPVITSFLPPTHTHLYLPSLFRLWEAFNSSVMDDRLIDLAGELSEEHVAAKFGVAGQDGGAEWKDVGIWKEEEWTLLIGKGSGSMNVPVGSTRASSTTAGLADSMADKQSLRIKKSVSRYHAIAKIFVYSMAVDGDIRTDTPMTTRRGGGPGLPEQQTGYIAGSKALDSLDRLITSTESFFHPSNSGSWTLGLTTLLHRLTTEFSKRWKEEEQHTCRTPVTHRLTPAIRRAFVKILRTPALLAMFSKDPVPMGYAQGALCSMAQLEPPLIMPELLERAYGGLETVNETHRTTAVLSMLSGISRPLVSEKVWLGGPKHVVPLLDLCIPGIDLNDPVKTMCATMFIATAVRHIKIGDLSIQQSGLSFSNDTPGEELMDVDDGSLFPEGIEADVVLSKEDERALIRDNTAGFADWVISLFRRVLALYENLPEEGGSQNKTGGKPEEGVLKSIQSMLDVVCLHLSDQLFDLVLKLVFDYATTNAKSNSVRAFGQLVACLARVRPEQTVAKFLPLCVRQIEEELNHGASSIRTTSSHDVAPSDTTLHWNMSILRGSLGFGGAALVKHKKQIIDLLALLVNKTKTERGYGGTGRLLTRVLHTLVDVYPLNGRFVNTDQWEDPVFEKHHNIHWGRMYEAHDVHIEWHVPSSEEITFILDILDQIARPALDKVESLLATMSKWDSIARNDFCRYLQVCKSIWSGLPTLFQEQVKDVANPCVNEDTELHGLLLSPLEVRAGFALTDPKDPRYQTVVAQRTRFGEIIQRAASALRQNTEVEDHIDAVIGVTKAIDVFLLGYGLSRTDFDALQKNYAQARDLNRMWTKQKENTRMVFVKRAHVYHSGRVYMHALYRRRSALDDKLLGELAELSLSPYSRVRRQAQSVFHNVCTYYVRSTKLILPVLFDALGKGNDPDRMKGALYILWNNGIAAYALADQGCHGQYLLSLLECQHEEKPSVQKLVNSLAQDCLSHLNEEAVHTDGYSLETPRVGEALLALETEFSPYFTDKALLEEAMAKRPVRVARRSLIYNQTISSILEVALRPQTHWRYVQMAARFLYGLLRRDVPTSPEVAKFFMEQSISPQPTIRVNAQRAVVKLTIFIKIRTYAKSGEELWLDEWSNPLQKQLSIKDPTSFLRSLERPIYNQKDELYVDKIRTGFLSWTETIKCYTPVGDTTPLIWEAESLPALNAISGIMTKDNYFTKLSLLWGQEATSHSRRTGLRSENISFVKSLAKMFHHEGIEDLLTVTDPLLSDSDRFKQRAGAEFLTGLLRGSKHWPKPLSAQLWSWTTTRLDQIFAQVKPDTMLFWEDLFMYQLSDRDPRRNQPLVNWILSLPLEFNGDSAFAMNKTLSVFGILVHSLGIWFNSQSDKYVNLMLDNANTGYAEISGRIAQIFCTITRNQWQPAYSSTDAFIRACHDLDDPLHIRRPKYADRITTILNQLPKWKEQRLPPPRVSQSEYDKVGLTLLHWIWSAAHDAQACLVFPYAISMMPEIILMSELKDSSELQKYSSAVLYVLSAVTPPPIYVEVILENFVSAIKSSKSWRIRLHALPALIVFFYRNLLTITPAGVSKVMDVLLDCLADENVEVREMASKVLSGVVRCSQRQSIVPLKNRFVALTRKIVLPPRQEPAYAESLRSLHSAILGLCALIESFPYSVPEWVPSLTEVLAPHATDPPPISTTIRQCASQFKKTHQDTWHKDQQAFDEEQLQSLSTMLVGTSYYA